MLRFFAQFEFFSPVMLVVLAMAVGVSTSYFPTLVSIEKDISTPFPCQSIGCGCKDANQCWASCCCHSNAEKLAWAKQNNVEPPKWFLLSLQAQTSVAQTTAVPATVAESEKSCCCCKSPQQKSVCATPSEKRLVGISIKQLRSCNGLDGDLLHLEFYFVASESCSILAESWPRGFSVFEKFYRSVFITPPEPPPDQLTCC